MASVADKKHTDGRKNLSKKQHSSRKLKFDSIKKCGSIQLKKKFKQEQVERFSCLVCRGRHNGT